MPKRDPKSLPTSRAEDVEFSQELADRDDMEAQRRAKEADSRSEGKYHDFNR
ncbi:YfhD family protein [Terrilactibacillus laevilacticus]|uniref:YfhD family protein n=1 Tax=Terrilactibacillus laevilacticus TaxID=1380157 RepID=A0ABW5PU75_9BACI|nr:YfhD family protein [Terrilactibacillus laevilacticus]